MSTDFKTLDEFYPYYLEEHSNRTNRRLYFVGSTASAAVFFYGVFSMSLSTFGACFLGALLIGYGMAWTGHFFFEHNKPATFKWPWLSFVSDWKMWRQMLTGKIAF